MLIKNGLFILCCLISPAIWASCSVTPPQATIGQYDPATSTEGVRALFILQISCNESTSFSVKAGPSQTSGSISSRQLLGEDPSSLLRYQLCLDANWGGPCNQIFGTPPDGYAISGHIAQPGGSTIMTFWAVVFGNQPAKPGWHDDFVLITVEP